MKNLFYLGVFCIIISCNENTVSNESSNTIDFSSNDKSINPNSQIITNYILNNFKFEIVSKLKEKSYIKVTLFDEINLIKPVSLDSIWNGKNISTYDEFIKKINQLKSNNIFLVDDNLGIVNCRSNYIDSINIINLEIFYLGIIDSTYTVLVTNLIYPEWGDGTLYKLNVNKNKNVDVISKRQLWVN